MLGARTKSLCRIGLTGSAPPQEADSPIKSTKVDCAAAETAIHHYTMETITQWKQHYTMETNITQWKTLNNGNKYYTNITQWKKKNENRSKKENPKFIQ